MNDAPRLLRGAMPYLVALTLVTCFALPANARGPNTHGPSATRAGEWWLTALNAYRAWRAAPGEGKGVTVAVLSTGVDAAHPDLAGDVTVGHDFCDSGRTVAGPFWGYEGTAVASLLAGHGHGQGAGHGRTGAAGITGIAPGARILAVQVTMEYNDPLNSEPAITRRLPGAIAAGIRYAVARGASVIALPLDPGTLGPATSGDPAAAGGSRAERAAVSYALAHNVVLIAPAGDNGASTGSVNFPAAYPGVLAVGAVERGGKLAPFTSTRGYVALTAPGSGLTVAVPDGGYSTLTSSDMSAALAAGVAALIRSRFPRLNATEVARAVETGTRPPGAHPAAGSGHGVLDAAGALTVAAKFAAALPAPSGPRHTPPPPTPLPSPRVTPHHAAIRAPVAGSLAGSLLRYAVIAALVLIVALAGALALTAARRRRMQAARRVEAGPRSGQGGSHARGSRADAARSQRTWEQHAGGRDQPAGGFGGTAGRGPGTVGTAGRGPGMGGTASPRIVPVTVTGMLGAAGRAQRRRKTSTDKPPWEPASPPEQVQELAQHQEFPALPPAPTPVPIAPATLPALPAGTRPSPGQPAALAPWEESPEEFAAAPVPADLPDWSVNSGPMYVWNPNASTAPQPAVPGDDDAEPAPG